jgi:short-subunit dehydrogenase
MQSVLVKGCTALVTGASSGIGQEFAIQLARRGCDLILVGRDLDRLRQLASRLEEEHLIRAIVIVADLSKAESAEEIHEQVGASGRFVDILINNAGFNVYGPFLETSLKEEIDMITVNLTSLVALSKLFALDMAQRGRGHILNLGSTASFAPSPYASVYAATKAAVLSLTEALAEELRGTGIATTVLCPGPTSTAFAMRANMTNTRIFSGKLESVQDVVRSGLAAIDHGRTLSFTRFANQLQIFSMRFSPRILIAKVGKSLLSPVS